MGAHSATRAERNRWIQEQVAKGKHRDIFMLARRAKAAGMYISSLDGVRRSLKRSLKQLAEGVKDERLRCACGFAQTWGEAKAGDPCPWCKTGLLKKAS